MAQPCEYTITSSRGVRKPRFFADNVEHTKSSTHISVHTPTTNSFAPEDIYNTYKLVSVNKEAEQRLVNYDGCGTKTLVIISIKIQK